MEKLSHFYIVADEFGLLLSTVDNEALLNNKAVLVERILVANMKYFSDTFNGIVPCNIQHTYSKEMIQNPLWYIIKLKNQEKPLT